MAAGTLTGCCSLSLQEDGKGAQRALRAMAMAAGPGAEAQGRLAQAAALVAWRASPRVPSWAARLWAQGRCSSWLLVCNRAHSPLRDLLLSTGASTAE